MVSQFPAPQSLGNDFNLALVSGVIVSSNSFEFGLEIRPLSAPF